MVQAIEAVDIVGILCGPRGSSLAYMMLSASIYICCGVPLPVLLPIMPSKCVSALLLILIRYVRRHVAATRPISLFRVI